MAEWRSDIESAPRDGSSILLAKVPCNHWCGIFVAYWGDDDEWHYAVDRVVRNPTHWMPLPAAPVQ